LDIAWTATSVDSGRYDPIEVRSDPGALVQRIRELREKGRGYLEVHGADDFPVLTVGFSGGCAIVQVMWSPERMELLVGEGSGESVVAVPIMDEEAEFGDEFAVSIERFGDGTSNAADLGEWVEL
jgi:hypothetical protein